MPLKPHPTDPDKMVYASRQYDIPQLQGVTTAQPEQEPWRESASDYERGFIDGMQKQAQSSVDKAVNRMAQTQTQKPVAWLEPEWGEKICPEVGYEVTMTDDHPRDLCWIPLYAQRPWVDLTPQNLNEIFAIARTGEHAVRLALDKLKEKNNAA